MSVGRSSKKFVLISGSLLAVLLAVLKLWLPAGSAGLAVFVWLAVETRRRTRFRFSDGPVREETFALGADVADLSCGASAVFVHPGGGLSVVARAAQRAQACVPAGRPLALLPLGGDRLLFAYEERLSLCDLRGGELKSLAFEAPLMRQSYRLVASADASRGALVTPWFVQVFDLALSGLLGRVRFEDAGHYFKYAALGASGRGLLLAGACLLPEDDGGALEARWGWWEQGADGAWRRRWGQSRESYENSQVRGVQTAGAPATTVLCTEVWRSGYAFELRGADGTLLWERTGAERPALSPDGQGVAFELPQQVLVMSDGRGVERWRRGYTERLRFKRPLDDGTCLVLEGRCLRRFLADGSQAPEVWLKNDAQHFGFDTQGRLVLGAGRHGARLHLNGRQ